MKKNKVFNVILVILMVMIAVSSVMLVGGIKGWFHTSEDTENAIVEADIGISSIERNGIAYSVDSETSLRDGDIIVSGFDSVVTIRTTDCSVVLGERTQVRIENASAQEFRINVESGEVFVVVENAQKPIHIAGSEGMLTSENGVFIVSSQTGSSTVSILSGTAIVSGADDEENVSERSSINFVEDGMSVAVLDASSLNEFMIEQAKLVAGSFNMCFSQDELDRVISSRNEAMLKAQQEQQEHDAEIIAQGGTEVDSSGSYINDDSVTDEDTTEDVDNILTCTIQIRCDTILDNMDNLTEGKDKYVPLNGCILSTSTVQFVEGETVYDVLKKTCSYAGIQLEYSYYPIYESVYVEGINHLYEFDCGNESGWMYKVNGWFPNYGCSKYELKDGDTIVWAYTCNGLGADLGGGMH